MKNRAIAAMAMMCMNGTALSAETGLVAGDVQTQGEARARSADVVEPPALRLAQRRSTPDTSTPGSTAPGNPLIPRPRYVPRQQQYYAAELRKCEAIGESSERLACKNSVRSKFDEMDEM
jgi:hypothetical protein